MDSVIDPDSIYKSQKPKTPRFQNVSFHGLLVNGNWFITNIILSMLLIIFNIRKIITIYKDVIEISKAQAPINTNVWRMNNGAENMDDFIKNGIITLIVTLILITGITFMGFMSANSSLEDQYNQKLDEYEDMLSAYNSNLEVYNQKLAVAQEFKETGLMNANVTVNTQHVNDERVGNEISYTTNVNGQGIDYSDTIQLQKDTSISLYAQVVDDEKYPDIGSDSKTVTPTIEELTSDVGYTATLTEYVHETYGRLAGNTAIYESTFIFKVDPESIKYPEELIATNQPTLEQISFSEYLDTHTWIYILCIVWIVGLFGIIIKYIIDNGVQ